MNFEDSVIDPLGLNLILVDNRLGIQIQYLDLAFDVSKHDVFLAIIGHEVSDLAFIFIYDFVPIILIHKLVVIDLIDLNVAVPTTRNHLLRLFKILYRAD